MRQTRGVQPILIIQHAEHEHPASLLDKIKSMGFSYEWIHPNRGDPYPKSDTIRGIISLGGPMSANDADQYPWILQELDLLKQCIQENRPVLGLCLGGQLLAKALDAKVVKNPTLEIGWFPLTLTNSGTKDPIFHSCQPNPLVYHWHQETFQLPKGATLLAHSALCKRQAFRIGKNAYGIQFHPEADLRLVKEWLKATPAQEEILNLRAQGNLDTVQDPHTQIRLAESCEKVTLNLVHAMVNLFNQ